MPGESGDEQFWQLRDVSTGGSRVYATLGALIYASLICTFYRCWVYLFLLFFVFFPFFIIILLHGTGQGIRVVSSTRQDCTGLLYS